MSLIKLPFKLEVSACSEKVAKTGMPLVVTLSDVITRGVGKVLTKSTSESITFGTISGRETLFVDLFDCWTVTTH